MTGQSNKTEHVDFRQNNGGASVWRFRLSDKKLTAES